ncbi:MAG: NADP-dependent oxidoreductase [Sphingomonas sp.]
MAEAMRAVRLHRFGGPEVLTIDELPLPQPRDDEVLLKLAAASVNPVDYKIRESGGRFLKEDELPVTLGRDVAGTIETCGTRAHNMLSKGDRLFAMLGFDRGGYADYAVVKATEMVAIPDGVDFTTAAAVPLASLTAWQGLIDNGGLAEGQRVLIHGGAGGVGHFAVQIAEAKGAYVYTTVGTEDLDFAHSLGADEVIDYKNQRFEDVANDVDLVLDLIGGETRKRSWAVIKPGGIMVSTLGEPEKDGPDAAGKRAAGFVAQSNAAQLGEIADLIAAGKVRPHVDRTFALEQAADAQWFLENEHVRGKIVLTVD